MMSGSPVAADAAGPAGELLSIAFANTLHMVRGELRDGLGTEPQLVGWLASHAGPLGIGVVEPDCVGPAEIADFGRLRNALRLLLDAADAQQPPAEPGAVSLLNEASGAAPRWPVLTVTAQACSVEERSGQHGQLPTALAAIARDAIVLLGSSLRGQVRACRAPGCTLYFVKDGSRRAWCCQACGNRARVARHYRRHRAVG